MSTPFNHPMVMGILNVTPDSFSDGGKYITAEKALRRALAMVAEGAEIIDIGGESTRPGAHKISLQEELDRTIPIIAAIKRETDTLISIDTSKPEVMTEAVKVGAGMINDVSALTTPGALEIAVKSNVFVCLMHMQNEPGTMQDEPYYCDVVSEVFNFLKERKASCLAAGIAAQKIIIDPGFGFGKSLDHNLTLLRHLKKFSDLQSPILVGVSRKAMIGQILGATIDQRLYGGLALAVLALSNGAVIIRTHDVKPTVDAMQVTMAVSNLGRSIQ